MNLIAARELIYQTFITNWTGRTLFSFENAVQEPTAVSHCYLSVNFITSRQVTLNAVGSRKFERLGTLIVIVSVPPNEGRFELDGHVNQLISDWEQVKLDDDLWFQDTSTTTLPYRDSGMYSEVFEADFVLQEIR